MLLSRRHTDLDSPRTPHAYSADRDRPRRSEPDDGPVRAVVARGDSPQRVRSQRARRETALRGGCHGATGVPRDDEPRRSAPELGSGTRLRSRRLSLGGNTGRSRGLQRPPLVRCEHAVSHAVELRHVRSCRPGGRRLVRHTRGRRLEVQRGIVDVIRRAIGPALERRPCGRCVVCRRVGRLVCDGLGGRSTERQRVASLYRCRRSAFLGRNGASRNNGPGWRDRTGRRNFARGRANRR